MVESELHREPGAEVKVVSSQNQFLKVGGGGLIVSTHHLLSIYFLSFVFCKMSTSQSCENNSQYLPSTFLA